ncbi:unnamed protein product, partial [Prorocentrum cordatum]
DPAAAIRVQDDGAKQVNQRWSLQIGEVSQERLACKGGSDSVVSQHIWDKMEPMKQLGRIIDLNGGICSCCAAAAAARILASLHGLDQGLRRATEGAKLRFLNSGVLSIA